MRKRNLILTLFLGSFFITSNVDSSVIDLYENKNSNNNLLIAGDCGGSSGGGGGGGVTIKEKRENALKKAIKSLKFFKSKKAAAGGGGAPTPKIDKKIKKWEKKIKKLDPNYIFPKIQRLPVKEKLKFRNLVNDQRNALKQKTNSMMEEIWAPYRRITEENRRRKESGKYNDTKFEMELLGLSPRSLNFTTAALDSKKDDNEARAETYHKLAIKSLENSLNKNEVDSSEEHHHHGLIALNYYHIGDFENSNKSLKKAASGYKKPKEKILTKTLIATTAILSGDVNQGCQDLYDYFADGDIVFDSTFPIEDFCIFDEEKL